MHTVQSQLAQEHAEDARIDAPQSAHGPIAFRSEAICLQMKTPMATPPRTARMRRSRTSCIEVHSDADH
jgi:hypothetical protein